MRVLLVCLLLAVATATDVVPQSDARFQSVSNPCFPDCTWNCDRPSCPAECEPQCEKPNCELRCEKLPPTACDIRCERPKCEVRCSRKNCQAGGCPLCENVCLPAKCQTVCTPAVPVCKPTCSAPKCTWSCRKPQNCPKPKCSLKCNARPNPQAPCQKQSCCPCNQYSNMMSAMELASKTHLENHGAHIDPESIPSMIELAHEIRLNEATEGSAGCCPCL